MHVIIKVGITAEQAEQARSLIAAAHIQAVSKVEADGDQYALVLRYTRQTNGQAAAMQLYEQIGPSRLIGAVMRQ